MRNRIISLVVLLAGFCCPAFSQGQFVTGSQVSDQDAYRFIYSTLSVASNAPQADKDLVAARLQQIGLVQDDQTVVTNQLAGYKGALGNYITTQNADATNSAQQMQLPQDDATFYSNVASLTQGKTAILFGQMSQSGFQALQAYVQAEKANMFVAVPQTPTGNVMSPNYSFYKTRTQLNANTWVQQIITQGTSVFSSACIACFSAQHRPSGDNRFIFTKSGRVVGGAYNGPYVTPPSAYVNYTSTINVVMPENIVDCDLSQGNQYTCYGDWGTVAGPKGQIVCTMASTIAGVSWYSEHFKTVITYTKVGQIIQPPHCTPPGLIQGCVYSVTPWCTAATTPPLWTPTSASLFLSSNPPGKVIRQHGWCARVNSNSNWTCGENKLQGPDVLESTSPKGACSK